MENPGFIINSNKAYSLSARRTDILRNVIIAFKKLKGKRTNNVACKNGDPQCGCKLFTIASETFIDAKNAQQYSCSFRPNTNIILI